MTIRTWELAVLEITLAAFLAFLAAARTHLFALMALLFWIFLARERFFTRFRMGRRREAVAVLLSGTCIAAGVLIGCALYTPAKVVEQRLQRPVILKSDQMSLAQLDRYAREHGDRFPLRVNLMFADSDRDTFVRWPSSRPTLREFIEVIESQTLLRHEFGHCGNGWTLLHGGDCSFGLMIQDPALLGPPPRSKLVYRGGM